MIHSHSFIVSPYKVLSFGIHIDILNKAFRKKLEFTDWMNKKTSHSETDNEIFPEIQGNYDCIMLFDRSKPRTCNIKEMCDKYFEKTSKRLPIIYCVCGDYLWDEVGTQHFLAKHFENNPFTILRGIKNVSNSSYVIISCVVSYMRVGHKTLYKHVGLEGEIVLLKEKVESLEIKLKKSECRHDETEAHLVIVTKMLDDASRELMVKDNEHQVIKNELAMEKQEHELTKSELVIEKHKHEVTKSELVIEKQKHEVTKRELAQSIAKHNDCTRRLYNETIKCDTAKEELVKFHKMAKELRSYVLEENDEV